MKHPAIKITGPRSLQSKLWRIADDMARDARRVEADDGDTNLANTLRQIGGNCRDLAKYLEPGRAGK
jgi:hypothetical protein